MAKKIVISFANNPIISDYFSYDIYLNGVKITYATALDTVRLDYTDVTIQPALQDTLSKTIDYLRTNHSYNKITYSIVNDTIEVLINYDIPIIINILTSTLSVTSEDIPTEIINLKYYLQYKNIVNDEYLLGIYSKTFEGISTEVSGNIVIEKGSVTEHLDAIRGTGLSVQLEATTDLDFEDLYTENEQDFLVRLYKNNKIFFVGYLKPDGIYQSFTDDIWFINFDCIDGLGALENLSYVKSSGLNFIGKQTAIDIIYNCLKRSGIVLNINTSINIYYDGLTLTDDLDILAQIKLNADRFVKTDDKTIMSCKDVLSSVLDLFGACITQQNGEWYIYRPNELYFSDIVKFKRYDLENNYISLVAKNLLINIGSQIDNFYPFHCNKNQRIEIKGGISAFRLGYKYGYISGLFENSILEYDSNNLIQGWTVLNSTNLIFDSVNLHGITFKDTPLYSPIALKTNIYPAVLGDIFTLKLDAETYKSDGTFGGKIFRIKIKCGAYYLKYTPRNTSTPISDSVNSEWVTTDSYFAISLFGQITAEIEIPSIPVSGSLTLEIEGFEPWLTTGGLSILNSIDLIPKTNSDGEVGEFHTVQRSTAISSLIKENKTVYNGDSGSIIYLGAIFKLNNETTDLWHRKGYFESKPLLRLAAEEELRISQKPLKKFSGDVYGYLPYLSIININNVNGKFTPIEYSYDTLTNITTLKNLELFCPEVSDLSYTFTYDYGNVVTPTIIG